MTVYKNGRTRSAGALTLLIVAATAATMVAQTGAPTSAFRALADEWLTYSGDYTGRRYSTLTQVDRSNVGQLGLRWVTRIAPGVPAAPAGRFGGFGNTGPDMPRTISGFGTGALNQSTGRPARIVSSALAVDGKLYAVDPRQRLGHRRPRWACALALRLEDAGRHPHRQPRHGHVAATGSTWRRPTTIWSASTPAPARSAGRRRSPTLDQQYFSTTAPIVIGNHVLVGTGNDLDAPGFLQVLRPRDRRREMDVVCDAAESGRSGARDLGEPRRRPPRRRAHVDSRLVRSRRRISTSSAPAIRRRPTPRRTAARATTSTPARWSPSTSTPASWPGTSQTSPHDTHDWDSTQTPVLVDAPFNGRTRKLVLQATRNGYFFVLDRVTGEHL